MRVGGILPAWPKQRDHLINIWLIAAGRWLISVCDGEHLPGLHAFLCNGMPMRVFLYPDPLLGNKLFPLKTEHNFAYSSLVPFHSFSAHKSKHGNENPQRWLIAFTFYLQVGNSCSSFFPPSMLIFFLLVLLGSWVCRRKNLPCSFTAVGLISGDLCVFLTALLSWHCRRQIQRTTQHSITHTHTHLTK